MRGVAQAVQVADAFLGEAAQVMPEGRHLRRLEVGAVGPHGRGVLLATVGGGEDEAGHGGVQVQQALPERQPERDPARLAAGPPGRQPARRGPQPAAQLPLPAVVGVPVGAVVGERLGRLLEQLQQGADQGGGRLGRQHGASNRATVWARSARPSPRCSSGASASSRSYPAATSSGAGPLRTRPWPPR
jgi:hypothetical protein